MQRAFATDPRAYRSGLEEKIAEQIRRAGLMVNFETFKLPFTQPAKNRTYTPDFYLINGIIIETKGLLTTEDKQKMILVKAQYPDLDIRFIFSNANAKIAKGSKTTYAMWAAKNGFPHAHKVAPPEWLTEFPVPSRVKALEAVIGPLT